MIFVRFSFFFFHSLNLFVFIFIYFCLFFPSNSIVPTRRWWCKVNMQSCGPFFSAWNSAVLYTQANRQLRGLYLFAIVFLFLFLVLYSFFIRFSSQPLVHDDAGVLLAHGTCSYNNHDKLFIIIIISSLFSILLLALPILGESIYFNSSTYVSLSSSFYFERKGFFFVICPVLWWGLLVLGLGEQCPHII